MPFAQHRRFRCQKVHSSFRDTAWLLELYCTAVRAYHMFIKLKKTVNICMGINDSSIKHTILRYSRSAGI
jgi:hypothetical protein